MNNKEFKSRITFLFTIILIGAIVVLRIDSIGKIVVSIFNAISPFLLGIVFALILNVPLGFVEKKIKAKNEKRKRGWAIVITIVAALIVLAFIFAFIVPQFINSLLSIVRNLSQYINTIVGPINALFDKFGINYQLNPNDIFDLPVVEVADSLTDALLEIPTIGEWIKEVAPTLFSGISDITFGLIKFFISLLMALIFSVYILISKEKLIKNVRKVLYAFFKEDVIHKLEEVAVKSNKVIKQFVGGTLTEMVILGSIFFICMSIFGIPFPLLIAVVIAITSIVPYFGTTAAMIFGAILIWADAGLIKMIIFIIMFIVIQQVENNLIYPRVVGESVGLPSLFVLLAVGFFGDLLGVVGLIIGVPLMAVIYTLLRDFVNERLALKKVNID